MFRIGPSGNSLAFYESGGKSTLEAAEWLSKIGLNAYEYSFGKGVNLSDKTAIAIGESMKKYDIEVSVHAPYYINFANLSEEQIQKSYQYIQKSIEKLLLLGGKRVVFHSSTQGKLPRAEAMDITKRNIDGLLSCILEEFNASNVILCPETMGKKRQIGTVEEIVDICSMHEILYPCFDFGHINSYMQGELRGYDDYRRIIDYAIDRLGEKKAFNMHIHFSKIQYGEGGEIRHLTLADELYGPEYQPLARIIDEYKMTPTIICESKEVMSEDALLMKKMHQVY